MTEVMRSSQVSENAGVPAIVIVVQSDREAIQSRIIASQ
jgi:hypothetical protein